MQRKYKHIQQYEQEMLELKAKGVTLREIGKRFRLTREQTCAFFKRYNRKQRELADGSPLKRRGQSNKNFDELSPSIGQ